VRLPLLVPCLPVLHLPGFITSCGSLPAACREKGGGRSFFFTCDVTAICYSRTEPRLPCCCYLPYRFHVSVLPTLCHHYAPPHTTCLPLRADVRLFPRRLLAVLPTARTVEGCGRMDSTGPANLSSLCRRGRRLRAADGTRRTVSRLPVWPWRGDAGGTRWTPPAPHGDFGAAAATCYTIAIPHGRAWHFAPRYTAAFAAHAADGGARCALAARGNVAFGYFG